MRSFIGLGANLGNRKQNIERALLEIAALNCTKIIKVSSLIETLPVGGPTNQGKYLNGVVEIETGLKPEELLEALQLIEIKLKRVRKIPNGPRTIDLDILLYGKKKIKTKKLQIPHPRMSERYFVMKPLLEIAPLIGRVLEELGD
ncbi:MAG: 2-amino-4-hydroxy-6-hydroxymethyldihydropteridine diphosphokinase [Candidatus Omnitrophica bacterium]|nr:2-amino-4-hydroxy-6-hydroxymethyldihydropteridine diphosphokinase [Candidatus Omnitrophota bacterium]